jgi:hypothetical protein
MTEKSQFWGNPQSKKCLSRNDRVPDRESRLIFFYCTYLISGMGLTSGGGMEDWTAGGQEFEQYR